MNYNSKTQQLGTQISLLVSQEISDVLQVTIDIPTIVISLVQSKSDPAINPHISEGKTASHGVVEEPPSTPLTPAVGWSQHG